MKFFLLFLFIQCGFLYGQQEWFFRNNINQELTFKTHIDSFPNTLYAIENDIVIVKEDTVNLKEKVGQYYHGLMRFYSKHIRTYIYCNSKLNDSLITILSFCFDRLIQVDVYARGSVFLNNIKYDVNNILKLKYYQGRRISLDSTIRYNDMHVDYGKRAISEYWHGSNRVINMRYSENFISVSGHIMLQDKRVFKRMPSWCGTEALLQRYSFRKPRTWENLEKYLTKN